MSDTVTPDASLQALAMPPSAPDSLQPLLMAMNAVLHEIKVLGRKVENVGDTMNSHITRLALIDQRDDTRNDVIEKLTKRVATLEDEREELAKSILAKCVSIVLFLSLVVVIAAAIITTRGPK